MKKNTLLIIAILLTAGVLQAATVGYTNSVAMPNDTDVTVNLTKFDTSLGTLTSVYIKYYAIISGANVQMDNDSAQAQNGTARVQNLVNSWSGPNTLGASFTPIVETADMQLNVSQVFNLEATSGDIVGAFDITGNGDYANWSPGTLTAGDEGFVNSAVWAGYQGLGTFASTINATYTTSATFGGELGFFQGNTPTGEFMGEVIYTYEPIPEPATASMMALAGAIAFLMRRHMTK